MQKIEHAGYRRPIISRKPTRYDEDGDELDNEAEDEYADAMAAEEDPYSDIKLEGWLSMRFCASSAPSWLCFTYRKMHLYRAD